MKGVLVIIEGSDSSGKATQTEMLYNKLTNKKYNVKKIDFPNYKSESSALVKMYLNGDFGSSAGDVNPYVASTFYAVDRFASFKKEWGKLYNEGYIIISDRYVTSNMIHQGAKITDQNLKNEYLSWLWDLEYKKFSLPVPDCVFFLDMPPEYSIKLMESRNNKITGEAQKDIHEKDYNYLIASYNNSREIAQKYKWTRIECVENGKIKSIDKIHDEVYSRLISNVIPKK